LIGRTVKAPIRRSRTGGRKVNILVGFQDLSDQGGWGGGWGGVSGGGVKRLNKSSEKGRSGGGLLIRQEKMSGDSR